MPKQKNAYLELAITCKNVAFRSCSTSRNFYGGLNISGLYTFYCRGEYDDIVTNWAPQIGRTRVSELYA